MANVTRFAAAGDLINRVAVSIGLAKTIDPFASQDPAFIQLCTLATEIGQELVQNNAWQKLVTEKAFTTAPGDTGIYELPNDFAYMIDQTGWQQGVPGSAWPLLGPASAQWWSYLQASELYTITIYAWFRMKEGKMHLWPQPPPPGIPIRYEYVSRGWVLDSTSTPVAPVYADSVDVFADIVLFEPILFVKKLKLAWLQAKGFDTTKAQDEFDAALESWIGKDTSAPVLNVAGNGMFGLRFLDGVINVPETKYGS
jgi:hypothetical protein